MKILVVHNFHKPGSASGDDAVVKREAKLLKMNGNEVKIFSRENLEIYESGVLKKAKIAFQIPWSKENYDALKKEIVSFDPDVVHIHTFFPLLSPSIYKAVYDMNKPIVQSVHDFRFFCPAAFLFRNGKICEECPEYGLQRAIRHRCLRSSFLQTLLAVKAVKKAREVLPFISTFIVFTNFSEQKLISFGIKKEKISLKPHFLLPEEIPQPQPAGKYFIFAGRLGEEKGIRILLQAWKNIDIPLKIAGSGPMEEWVKENIYSSKQIKYLGFLSRKELLKNLAEAYAVIVPSISYETFGLAVLEAYAAGIPVVASKVGSLTDLVTPGKTGLLFERKNPEDLAEKILWLWTRPEERDRMAREARREFEEKYTAEKNYNMLMEIYRKAIEKHKKQ